MMIHYHGLPITPLTAAVAAVSGGHAFVSFRHPEQLSTVIEVCQSFAIDNGAFSAWRSGNPITNWSQFYNWVEKCSHVPSFDFAVIPDVIEGSEFENDYLVWEWPFPRYLGAPVWHMHESISRLEQLVDNWPRICIGSSGTFATVGTQNWWYRINEAMSVICDKEGKPRCKIHGLRMMNPKIFTKLPFSSVDSTNIGRNIGLDQHWSKGHYLPPTKEARAMIMRSRIEAYNAPSVWNKLITKEQEQ